MVVQHNMQAANASRMLNINVSALSKSTEKLSSGYRINRAADDAAGLSISEKMRKQIRGLTQASSNAEDGISLVQTAEGALTEVHSMLQRMNELAVQAANGTYTSADIATISDEITQLSEEITRITSTTDFNGINLFGAGGTSSKKSSGSSDSYDVTGSVSSTGGSITLTSSSGNKIYLTLNSDGTVSEKGSDETTTEYDSILSEAGVTYSSSAWSSKYDFEVYTVKVTETTITSSSSSTDGDSVDLFVGYTSQEKNTITIDKVDTSKFNLVSSISSNDDAKAKLSLISSAIAAVSAERSRLGAIQNRLEHTVDNLNNVIENVTTAESGIRDTDMASEMVNYSKYSILQSAGQSMLAQANSANQGVLSLLQ